MFAKLITPDAPKGAFLLLGYFTSSARSCRNGSIVVRDRPRRIEGQLIMAIYKLTPLNPTDSIWRQFPFIEAVWTNARDEPDARTLVSKVAHELNPDLVGPMNYWPWMYFARCAADETQFAIARDEVVDSFGRSVATQARPCLAAE
jgi:hypothetical protein